MKSSAAFSLATLGLAAGIWLVPGGGDVAAKPAPAVSAAGAARAVFESAYPTGARPRPPQPVIASAYDAELGAWNLGGTGDPSHPANQEGFHPAVRVLVETRALRNLGKRGLTDRGILAQTRNHGYWPLRLCYEDSLREKSDARGETVMRFSIGRSGKVTYVRPLRSQLPKSAVSCLRQALYKLRFSPAPQSRVDVDFSVKLNPGDVPVMALPESKETASSEERAAFAAATDAVGACYSRGLAKDRGLWGRLELQAEIGPAGKISQLTQGSSRFADTGVVDCVAQQLSRDIELSPPPAGARRLTVAYRLGSPPQPAGDG